MIEILATLSILKPDALSLSKEGMYSLKLLRNERKMFTKRAHKCNITVVMSRSDHERKVNEHLHNRPYEKTKKNKCRATLNRLKAQTE